MPPVRLPDPRTTASRIQRRIPFTPEVGIVLGSGFAQVADEVESVCEFDYADLPGFPVGRVPGHEARLVLGHWAGTPVAVLRGRAHYYEGFDLGQTTFPIRVLAALGIQELLVTNAAGAIRTGFRAGDFMALSDHINGIDANPLRGMIHSGAMPFVDLSQAYDPALRTRLLKGARRLGIKVHSGVYLAVPGPSYETPAEIRAFRRLGADAVGMSTVPEVIVARHCGVQVAGLSCLTNLAAGLGKRGRTVNHEEVLSMARERLDLKRRLISVFLRDR